MPILLLALGASSLRPFRSGDGMCDSRYNNAACDWDGGEETLMCSTGNQLYILYIQMDAIYVSVRTTTPVVVRPKHSNLFLLGAICSSANLNIDVRRVYEPTLLFFLQVVVERGTDGCFLFEFSGAPTIQSVAQYEPEI